MDTDKLFEVARRVHASGLCPPDVRSPEACFAVMLAGAELGFQPMQSLRSLAIVKGKISLGADATIALCVRSPACRYFRVVESTDSVATYETQRDGHERPTRLTWTIAQATRAGLTSQTWKAHPEAMLRARCAAALARTVYPDVVAGIYDPDEAREIAQPKTASEEPEGSRAFAQFVTSVEVADRIVVVHLAYRDLLAGLAEEGGDVQEYLDGKGGAYTLAVEAIRRRVSISEAEVRAVLATEVPELARGLDLAADHTTDLDTAARWWVSTGATFAADHQPIVRKVLARTVAGIAAGDAVATGKAMRAMAAAVAALRPPEPPTGTDAPAASEQVAAEGTAAQSDGADWTRSREGMRAHLAGKSAVKAVLNSVVAHGSLRGYATLAAERIQALTGWDLDTCEAQITDAFAKANERRERDAETAAMVRRAA